MALQPIMIWPISPSLPPLGWRSLISRLSSNMITSTTENYSKLKPSKEATTTTLKPINKSPSSLPFKIAILLISITTTMTDNLEYALPMKDGHPTNTSMSTLSLVEIFVLSQMVKTVEDAQSNNSPIENYGQIHPFGLRRDYQLREKTSRFQQNGNSSWMWTRPEWISSSFLEPWLFLKKLETSP